MADLAAAGAAGGLGLADGVPGSYGGAYGAFSVSSQMVSSFWAAEACQTYKPSTCVWPRVNRPRPWTPRAGRRLRLRQRGGRISFFWRPSTRWPSSQRLDDLLLELVGDLVEELIHIRILLEELLVPVLDHRSFRASRTFLSSVSIAALASSMKFSTILSNNSWLKLACR